jgi:hypothetical protein
VALFMQTQYPMKSQPKQAHIIFRKVTLIVLSALCFVSLSAVAKSPEYDPGVLKNYQKIGLIRVTSDEQLFVTRRRYERDGQRTGDEATSASLVSYAMRRGFSETHKPFNDALKRNMRPEIEQPLFDALTRRLKEKKLLSLDWTVPAAEAEGLSYRDLKVKAKFLGDAHNKCPDCDAVLVVDAGFGAHDITTSSGFRARAEAEVFFFSLPDGKTWQRSILISDDKDTKFHYLYYPDAITNAAAIADRLPALVPILADQIVAAR